MTELASGITGLNLGIANVYLIRGPDGLTLLDTGGPGSPAALERQLARRGLTTGDIGRIIVTHAHYDHAGGAAEIAAASGAEVWAHSADSVYLRSGQDAPRPDRTSLNAWERLVGRVLGGHLGPLPVQRELQGGERLPEVHPEAEVLHLPGHSPGQIGLWFPGPGVLLGGDVVGHFLPWRLSVPLAAFTPDPALARRSIRQTAALNVRTLGVGHGAALIGNANAQLQRLAQSLPE